MTSLGSVREGGMIAPGPELRKPARNSAPMLRPVLMWVRAGRSPVPVGCRRWCCGELDICCCVNRTLLSVGCARWVVVIHLGAAVRRGLGWCSIRRWRPCRGPEPAGRLGAGRSAGGGAGQEPEASLVQLWHQSVDDDRNRDGGEHEGAYDRRQGG